MRFCSLVFLILVVCQPVWAETPVQVDIKSLEWNRYTTESFTILAIDNDQGRYIYNNVEKFKKWFYWRWGFPDAKFSRECRILVVKDKSQLKKLFGIDKNRIEIRSDMMVIWVSTENGPIKSLSDVISEACLADLEYRTGSKYAWWFHRGVALLSNSLSDIRIKIKNIDLLVKKDASKYDAESLMIMTEEKYKKSTDSQQELFDHESMMLCILMRKEFGQQNTHDVAAAFGMPEKAIKEVLGFDDFSHFGKSYDRFFSDMLNEVNRDKVPDKYLDITPAK